MGDINAIHAQIRAEYGDKIPLLLLGHSWGSFLCQRYIEGNSEKIQACMLSGSNGKPGGLYQLGVVLLPILSAFLGVRTISSFVRNIAQGSFNKPFMPNKTYFDWGTRDEAEIALVMADPLCKQAASVGFFRDVVRLCMKSSKKSEIAKTRKDLPLYIFSGSRDSVGDLGRGPVRLVKAYRDAGLRSVDYVLYPGARHELFHETNREEVMENLLAWINKTLDKLEQTT
jgi:alpha-beta hydrolase superfamily lysophospholipase